MSSTTKDKMTPSRQVGEAETRFDQKLHPWHIKPQSGGISQTESISLRSEGYLPHIGYLKPLDLQQRDELLKWLALKTNGALVQQTLTAVSLLLNGSCTDSLTLGHCTKAAL